jgi:DNA-binding HxlR family transcriptional regulator
LKNIENKVSQKSKPVDSSRMVEVIYGCKWSLTVYQLLNDGFKRPGEMVRVVDGLTTKVLNDCLKRNIEFGIINRVAFNEIPPRVEYEITAFGDKFLAVLQHIETLQHEIDAMS